MINKKTSYHINQSQTLEAIASKDFFSLSNNTLQIVAETCLANDMCFIERNNKTEYIYENENRSPDFFDKLTLELLKYGITNNDVTNFTDNETLIFELREGNFSLVEQLLISKKEEIYNSSNAEYISKLLMEINTIVFGFTQALSILSMDRMKNEEISLGVRKLKILLSSVRKDINERICLDDENKNKLDFGKLPIDALMEELFLSVDFLLVLHNSEIIANGTTSKSATTHKHNKKQDDIGNLFIAIQSAKNKQMEFGGKISQELLYLLNEFNKHSSYLRAKLDLQFNEFQQESYFESTCKYDKLQFNITNLKNNHNSRFHNLIECYYELAGFEYNQENIVGKEYDSDSTDVFSKENIQFILNDFLIKLSSDNLDIRLYFNIIDAIMYYSSYIDQTVVTNFQKNINKELNRQRSNKYKNGDFSLFLSSTKGLYKNKDRYLQEEKDGKLDALTGLLNVKSYSLEIIDAINKSKRSNNYIGLMMLDLDKFKNINDTYGHIYGDRVLSTLALVLNNNTRNGSDKIFRIGGEEFAIIFEVDNENEAMKFGEKLREAIELNVINTVNQQDGNNIKKTTPVTTSIGIDRISIDDNMIGQKLTEEELLLEATRIKDCADKALFLSKENGRNQVTRY